MSSLGNMELLQNDHELRAAVNEIAKGDDQIKTAGEGSSRG